MDLARHRHPHDSEWLMRQPEAGRRLRLFCLPCARGNAARYLAWQKKMPPCVEVCAVLLPGRGTRLREPPLQSLPVLIDMLAPVIARHGDLPFVFFRA